MQSFIAGTANTLTADIVARADGTPITSGTVTFYLMAQTGANAGKWFQTSDDSWQATEQSAGTGTHKSDGHWSCSIDAAAWTTGIRYYFYAKESGNLHIPYGEEIHEAIATADKLKGYVQLLARKDTSIETDRSTELAEINADEGSGAGTFSNLTDSFQSIRDRGDNSWLTGATGFAVHTYTTTDWTRTVGDDDGGSGSDTAVIDGTYFSTGETNTGTYLEIDGTFTIGDDEIGVTFDLWGFYNGGGSHYITVLAYDTVNDVYEPLVGSIPKDSSLVSKYSFSLAPQHTAGDNTVKIKLLHAGGSGNTSHVVSIDKAEVLAASSLDILTAAQVNAACDEAISDAALGTSANQTSILEDLEDIKGTGFVKDTNSLVNVTGATPVNVTVETTVVE